MEFFESAVDLLQTLVIALGAGLGIWGVVNLRLLFRHVAVHSLFKLLFSS